MSERQFILEEAQGRSPYFVTKSELERRIYKITNGLAEEKIRIDTAIDILLHGEKEQPWPGPEDILEMRGKEQPDEWEEWASNLAKVLKTGPEHGRHLRKLFLSIPSNPRRRKP